MSSASLPALTLLSVIIPARDEAGCIIGTVRHLHRVLSDAGVPHEILVVNDGSRDGSWQLLQNTVREITVLRPLDHAGPHGFGRAVSAGLDAMHGDAAVIMMADESDDPQDVVRYWSLLNAGWECVFGSRFITGGSVVDYPRLKLLLNRAANKLIALIFNLRFNDTTNAFKAYRREVIAGCRPLLSPHFNLTIELPLKAVVRGYSWTTMPITWKNRRTGAAKFQLKEMGSRYFFIMVYIWLEKHFSRGDYRRKP
ncbi:MAG: glycosyltransferase family 2 protein [Prosthecobacter sp.]|uniref:glycosyltransferase family 2 protein n=1 Tax=Prosthecobacter sp. TaxID=1965333 RepID=UPI0039033C1D